MTLSAADALRPRRNWQAIVTVAILLVVGFLVILPMVFLIEESLNVGDPMSFPPQAYGLKNYFAIFEEDINVLWNTLIIAVMATIMAILIGFTLAWILTRTNVPGSAMLERLMELPYYMTPLVGALAWAIIAGPKSGFMNQLWKGMGGSGDIAGRANHRSRHYRCRPCTPGLPDGAWPLRACYADCSQPPMRFERLFSTISGPFPGPARLALATGDSLQ